jgi:hypothetical protein
LTSVLDSRAESAAGVVSTGLDGEACCATGTWVVVAGPAVPVDGWDAGPGATGPTPGRDYAQATVNSAMANDEALRIIRIPSCR